MHANNRNRIEQADLSGISTRWSVGVWDLCVGGLSVRFGRNDTVCDIEKSSRRLSAFFSSITNTGHPNATITEIPSGTFQRDPGRLWGSHDPNCGRALHHREYKACRICGDAKRTDRSTGRCCPNRARTPPRPDVSARCSVYEPALLRAHCNSGRNDVSTSRQSAGSATLRNGRRIVLTIYCVD